MKVELVSWCELGKGRLEFLSNGAGKWKMSLSRTGIAELKALAERQRWAKIRWDDVKHEDDGSSRNMAFLIG